MRSSHDICEAVQDHQASEYDRAGIELPERAHLNDWENFCDVLTDHFGLDERDDKDEFRLYLKKRAPVGFESWDHFVGLLIGFRNLSRAPVLSELLRAARCSMDPSHLILATVPSGQASATIGHIRGSKIPVLFFDTGLRRVITWIALLHRTLSVPVDGTSDRRVDPSQMLNDGAAVTLAFIDQLVSFLICGVFGPTPKIEQADPNSSASRAMRSCGYLLETFVLGHEIAHLSLGHLDATSKLIDVTRDLKLLPQSHEDEYQADMLGFLIAAHSSRAALSNQFKAMSPVEQSKIDGQSIAYVDFFLWFYQAIEYLIATSRYGEGAHFLDTSTHPSATVRRVMFANSGVQVYTESLAHDRPFWLHEAMAKNVNEMLQLHANIWSTLITIAHNKLKERLAAGESLSPLWNDRRPCEGPSELKAQTVRF